MTMIKNLMKRGNVFYARVAVPKELRDLRKAAGEAKNPVEITRSLNTSDRKVAERLLPAFLVAIHREFDQGIDTLRSASVLPLVKPRGEDLALARAEFFAEELERDELERVTRKSFAEVEAIREGLVRRFATHMPQTGFELLHTPGWLELVSAESSAEMSSERRRILAEEIRQHLAQANYVLVSDAIEGIRQRHGLDIEPDSLTYKALGRGLLETWQQALKVAERRDQGLIDDESVSTGMPTVDRGGRPSEEHRVVNLNDAGSKRPRRSESLHDYLDAYLKEQKEGLSRSGQQDLRATVRQFIECNGNRPVTEYTRSDMAAYKKGLQRYPVNAAKLYPGIGFKQVLSRNGQDGHPTLNSNTVRGKLSALSALGKWLEANVEGVDATSFSTTLPKRNDRKRMEPFTLEEVRKILNSHAFTGSESAQNYQKPGTVKLRGWHFWLTLIAAFTGARVNEIVQMGIDDLREEDGIWVFSVTDEADGQSLKTAGSKRLVPVHPRLIELGLLAYRDALALSGARSLFEDAPIGKDGRRSEAASRWFRRFLEKIGVKQPGSRGGVHRWRHTIADALRRARVKNYAISALLGHSIDVSRMTQQYGRETDMTLRKQLESLSKMDYPGVDFTLIAPEP